MAEKKKISAKKILADIKSGATDEELMAKYQLSSQGLQTLFRKMIGANLLTESDLDDRARPLPKRVDVPAHRSDITGQSGTTDRPPLQPERPEPQHRPEPMYYGSPAKAGFLSLFLRIMGWIFLAVSVNAAIYLYRGSTNLWLWVIVGVVSAVLGSRLVNHGRYLAAEEAGERSYVSKPGLIALIIIIGLAYAAYVFESPDMPEEIKPKIIKYYENQPICYLNPKKFKDLPRAHTYMKLGQVEILKTAKSSWVFSKKYTDYCIRLKGTVTLYSGPPRSKRVREYIPTGYRHRTIIYKPKLSDLTEIDSFTTQFNAIWTTSGKIGSIRTSNPGRPSPTDIYREDYCPSKWEKHCPFACRKK
ncbi:hypothetical protein ACFL2Q_04745 [Thermodesulfobacteriota bacterium]